MKRLTAVLLALAVLQSCASIKALPESELDSRARGILDGPSQVDPLEVSIGTDYVGERITLIQTVTISNSGSESNAPDTPLGIYFGNGLFLDASGSVALLLDRLAGVDAGFQGRTEYLHYVGSNPHKQITDYSGPTIKVKDDSPLVLAKDYHLKPTDKRITVSLSPMSEYALERQDGGKFKVVAPISLNPFAGITFEKTSAGVKSSWLDILPKSNEYVASNGIVSDTEKTIRVENTGVYLRFAELKGNKYSFRIYRTPTMVLVMQEDSGRVLVIRKTPTGLEWQQSVLGPFEIKLDKKVTYSFTVARSDANP